MRRFLICTGILGGGSALTFAAAALAATMLPSGTVIPASGGFGAIWEKGGIAVPMPAPAGGGWIQVDDGTSVDPGIEVAPPPDATDTP